LRGVVNAQSPVLVAFAIFTLAFMLERAREVGRPLPYRQRIPAHVILRLLAVARWVDRRWGR
jgi:hypothetical protein